MVLTRKSNARKPKQYSSKRSRRKTGKTTTRAARRVPKAAATIPTDDDFDDVESTDENVDGEADEKAGVYPTDLEAESPRTSQWKLSGMSLGIPRLMRFVSKWVNTSNDEPVEESDNRGEDVVMRETVPESDAESIAESTGLSSLSDSFDACEQGFRYPKMNKHGIYRPRGFVKTENGVTYWRDNNDDTWKQAVYHSEIRGQLIDECAQKGRYEHRRARGKQPLDITAFHPDQQDWGFERENRPAILHQYEKKGHEDPTYPVLVWKYNGAIVLDFNDSPILDFKNMPATISSKVEGGLQEAIIREDSRIDANDFRVRMLTDPLGRGTMSLPGVSAISMRRSRFRWTAGYLSWTPRMGSGDIKRYLDGLLPEHCKATNSTKGFRELKASEVKLMAAINRGKHLKRAGARALTEEQRSKVDKSFYKSIGKAMKQEKLIEQIVHGDDGGQQVLQEMKVLTKDYQLDVVDYRFMAPLDEVEEEIVYRSIFPALNQCVALTGEKIELPSQWDYARRWNALQTHLFNFWRREHPDLALPQLDQCRDPWEEGFPI